MFYNAAQSVADRDVREKIGLAYSDDLQHWTRYDGNPVFQHDTKGTITGDAQIARIDDLYVMFFYTAHCPLYTYSSYNSFAVSRDLIHWTEWKGEPLVYPTEPYEDKYAHKSFVVKTNGVVYHYYCAVTKKGERTIALATSKPVNESAMQTVSIDGRAAEKTFEGIGAVSGGGATAVLLKDYPEPYRSHIFDMVYRPMFGASLSALLVEIPGDGNSTQGSMPSHSHYRGDYNYRRGYTWWVMQEAKSRNPQLTLDATAWSAPGWVGGGKFWSQDAADYYVSWLRGLREIYGLELDAIGCRNEKGVNYDFAKTLRRTLNEGGFGNVRLHAFDNWGKKKLDFLSDMRQDSALQAAIDIVSAHTFGEIPVTREQHRLIDEMGKTVWNSEDHVYKKGFDCLISIVECFNRNYIESGATKVINWYDIAGVYPMEPYSEDPAMLLAREPWSGHYTVRKALWGYAHYGQFTHVGWQYVDEGCRKLDGGGTMVTLHNPKTGDYSIIIETKGATTLQPLTIKIGKGLSKEKLCLWRSNAQQQFEQLPNISPRGKRFCLELQPNTVYSLSTTTGQQKGTFADIPASQPFPLPYAEDFEQYGNPASWGYLPHYTADIIGAFELAERPDGEGKCLRQVVGEHTQSWAPEWHYYTILGDSAWTDYEVSTDIYLNPQDEAAVMGRVCHVGTGYGIVTKGYYLKLDDKGRCSLVITRGKKDKKALVGDAEQQALIAASQDDSEGGERLLATAQVDGVGPLGWHRLTLRMEGDTLTGYVDGRQVVTAISAQYPKGMAGLLVPMQEKRIPTPYFDNMRITPIGSSHATTTNLLPDTKPLYE